MNENFRALRPHNRADKFITREKNNHQFFIYGPQCEKMRILGYSGGPGWPINNPTENDEVSADVAADAAERRLNHSIPRTYFVRGIQLW